MRLKELMSALLFAAAYWLLFAFLIGYTVRLGSPNWWYPAFGQNNVSAITWMQIVHTLGVIGGAIPVAVAIVYLFPKKSLRISFVVAGVACVVMLYDAIRGYYLLFQIDSYAPDPFQVVSSGIDVVKVPALLIAATWLVTRVVPSNQRMERTRYGQSA
jgi:hypothetical protein